jgi:hypothetical protein
MDNFEPKMLDESRKYTDEKKKQAAKPLYLKRYD